MATEAKRTEAPPRKGRGDPSEPTQRQHDGSNGVRVISGAFWGLLIGLIFFVPFLGYLPP
jgi:uncharacterized membrane protein